MEAFLQYLTFPFLLEGMWLTLRIFAASMVGGLALGLLIALMRLPAHPGASSPGRVRGLVSGPGAAGAAAAGVPVRRPAVHRHRDAASDRRDHRLLAERGRLRGRDSPRRHPLGEPPPRPRPRLARP